MNAIPLPTCAVATFRDSNDQTTTPWYAASPHFDLNAAGRNGSARVTAKVAGYWSSDVITLYIERKIDWSTRSVAPSPAVWTCTMSHSSGGRLTELSDNYPAEHYTAVADDLDAEMNFGAALISLSQFGRELANHFDTLEAAYQERHAELKAERDAEKAAKQAAVEADAPLGVPAAKKLVAVAKAQVQEYCNTEVIRAYVRGQDNFMTVSVAKTTRTTWYWSGTMIGEDALIAKLAEMSNRTTAA
jgi:hypothetical protein